MFFKILYFKRALIFSLVVVVVHFTTVVDWISSFSPFCRSVSFLFSSSPCLPFSTCSPFAYHLHKLPPMPVPPTCGAAVFFPPFLVLSSFSSFPCFPFQWPKGFVCFNGGTVFFLLSNQAIMLGTRWLFCRYQKALGTRFHCVLSFVVLAQLVAPSWLGGWFWW